MGNFDKYSNYDISKRPSSVVFGSNKPILETELNELQQIQENKLNNILIGNVGGIYPANIIRDFGSDYTLPTLLIKGETTPAYINTYINGNMLSFRLKKNINITLDNNDYYAENGMLFLVYRCREISFEDNMYEDNFLGLFYKRAEKDRYGEIEGASPTIISQYPMLDDRINVETTRRLVYEYILLFNYNENNITNSDKYKEFISESFDNSYDYICLGRECIDTNINTNNRFFYESYLPWVKPTGLEQIVEYKGIPREKNLESGWLKKTVVIPNATFTYIEGTSNTGSCTGLEICIEDELGIKDYFDIEISNYTFREEHSYTSLYAQKPFRVDLVDIVTPTGSSKKYLRFQIRSVTGEYPQANISGHLVLTILYKNVK